MTEWTDDGRPAAWVTELEPEFDANERDSWLALTQWRAAICPDCGNPVAICSNPEGVFGEGFYPIRRICWVRAAEQVATRKFDAIHRDAKPDSAGYLPTDGVVIRASLENERPDDDFLSGGLVDVAADLLRARERAAEPYETPDHTDAANG